MVRFNFDFISMGYKKLFSGQSDFIVLAPNMGVMIIEVKGSRGFNCVNGQWHTVKEDGSTEPLPNPFEQAVKNKHNIVDKIICRGLGINSNYFSDNAVLGHLVAFPNCRVAGNLCYSQLPQIFVTHSQMSTIGERIEHAFVDWGIHHIRNRNWFSGAVFERVVDILRGDMRLVEVAAMDAEADSTAIEQLTREQYDGFKELMAKSRVLVSGPAGSGKTMLAVWAAQALASMGYKVLIVCFNRNLSKWIEAKYDLPELITVRRYHAISREYAQNAGLTFNPQGGDGAERFWSETSAAIFLDAITILEDRVGDQCKFDAVIVDEGQDFSDHWWTPLEVLLKNPDTGHFVIFHDPDQSVYSHADDDGAQVAIDGAPAQQAFPINMRRHVLTKNCRNTRSVVKYCGGVLRTPQRPDFVLLPFERSPDGVPPILLPVMPIVGNRAARAADIVNGWIREGFKPSQIALISPWNRNNQNSILLGLQQIGQNPIKGDDADIQDWIDGNCLWGSTIKSFKGMEADCIIIADVPSTGARGFNLSDMYVAASRARRNLVFIPMSEQASREIRNWINGN